jgi:hypothetical protein
MLSGQYFNANTLLNLADIIFMSPKHNQAWGVDYMLMEKTSLSGNIGGVEYETFIAMFMNIWNVQEYSLLEHKSASATNWA